MAWLRGLEAAAGSCWQFMKRAKLIRLITKTRRADEKASGQWEMARMGLEEAGAEYKKKGRKCRENLCKVFLMKRFTMAILKISKN